MPRRRSPAKTRSRRSARRSLRRSVRRSPRRSPKRSPTRRSPKRRTGRRFRAAVVDSVRFNYLGGELTGTVIVRLKDTLTIQFTNFPRDLREEDELIINGQQWTVATVHSDSNQIVFTRKSGDVESLADMLATASVAPHTTPPERRVVSEGHVPPLPGPPGLGEGVMDDIGLEIEDDAGSSRMLQSSIDNTLGNQPDEHVSPQRPTRFFEQLGYAPRRPQRPGDLANLRRDDGETPPQNRDRSPCPSPSSSGTRT